MLLSLFVVVAAVVVCVVVAVVVVVAAVCVVVVVVVAAAAAAVAVDVALIVFLFSARVWGKPLVGVTAPEDAGNKRVLTQSFVHRTHVEALGLYYHPVFKNWFSDDWVTRVYGFDSTALLRHQQVCVGVRE